MIKMKNSKPVAGVWEGKSTEVWESLKKKQIKVIWMGINS